MLRLLVRRKIPDVTCKPDPLDRIGGPNLWCAVWSPDLLSLAVDLENLQTATTAAYAVVFGLYLLAAMLLLLGLVGLYASQLEAAGTLGLVSFLVACAGTTLVGGAVWFELFISPALAAQAPDLARAELEGWSGSS